MKKVYIIQVYNGSWDDAWWYIHGVYEDAFLADEEKKRLLNEIEMQKQSSDKIIAREAKEIISVDVREYAINEAIKYLVIN